MKPSIPLTPPKNIPSFEELRKRSTGKPKSPANPENDLLIDFSTPGASGDKNNAEVPVLGREGVPDPFSPITGSISPRRQTASRRPEEEPQNSAVQRQAELERQAQKQAILDQRAARRKSMANRRVSFAPEATLHTWSVMELAEDSTTSSASNSTRRQSSMTAQRSPISTDPVPSQSEGSIETLVEASPAKRRRRSSEMPSGMSSGMPDTADDESLSSSPSGDIVVEISPARTEEDSIHSADDLDDGDTAMSVEDTTNTLASDRTSSTSSSLDERLRRAAKQAGTRGIAYDEFGDDLSMELVTGTVTNAFQPWVNRSRSGIEADLSPMQDQENVDQFSPNPQASSTGDDSSAPTEMEDQEQTMEVTKAIGGILPGNSSPGKTRRKSAVASRRRSSMGRRRSSGETSLFGDETMDFTTVGGGILLRQDQNQNPEAVNEGMTMSDEDVTMEFTHVMGGVVSNNNAEREDSVQQSQIEESETMDMTAAFGGILPPIEERTEPVTDTEDNNTTPVVTRKPAESTLSNEKPHTASATPVKGPGPNPKMSVASETGSPSLAPRSRSAGRQSSVQPDQSTTPRDVPQSKSRSPGKRTTPTKQVTPLPMRAETPNKTPILTNVTHRSASPKRLFKEEMKAKGSPNKTRSPPRISNGIFAIDEKTGHHTPSVVLHAPKPHQHLRRRSSGIGIDQEGVGSPRVSELLSRRTSIGDAAPIFVPHGPEKRTLGFADPRAIEAEVDAEREEEERRESGRYQLEREANEPQEENVTLQLKEMIESMSPKKPSGGKLKGRKSLAVGAAKGLLGKRPAELDMDDDNEELTPKRLKAVSRESSPVKKIHLPKHGASREISAKPVRSKHLKSPGGTATPVFPQSPSKSSAALSPEHKGHFRDMSLNDMLPRPSCFGNKLDNVVDAIDVSTVRMQSNAQPDVEEEKISLQDFLNMTNIHFIELSTTKRRHTAAPETIAQSEDDASATLGSCFTAAATTLPLLELYQHATRELKSYISSGRKIIRTIEAETLLEQPPLFREYLDARPDVRLVMDNQFRNGKSNARLQSKQGWYTWREQLVDGLRGGLESIKNGMQEDAAALHETLELLSQKLPQLKAYQDELQNQVTAAQERLEELESVDQEDLQATRMRLKQADNEYLRKAELLQALQQQMNDKVEALEAAEELKTEMKDQIAEADRVREECRGIPTKDVLAVKARLASVEKETMWHIVAAEEDVEDPNDFGVALTMLYKDSLRLFFYPGAFHLSERRRRSSRRSKSNSGPTAPVGLTFAPQEESSETVKSGLSTECRFFLQLLQSQIQAYSMMPRGSMTTKQLLKTVAAGWDTADKVSEEVRLLNTAGVTTVSILGDEKLGACLKLMLPEGKGRVDINFDLHVSIETDGSVVAKSSGNAKPVYGRIQELMTSAKTRKVQQALCKEIEGKDLGTGSWLSAVKAFEQWVGEQAQPKPSLPAEQKPTAVTSATSSDAGGPDAVLRSPLAAKRSAAIQKRSIPIPAQRHQDKLQPAHLHPKKHGDGEKENIPPPPPAPPVMQSSSGAEEIRKPAMAPEIQEAMMHTPIKRIGALRRSPIGGAM